MFWSSSATVLASQAFTPPAPWSPRNARHAACAPSTGKAPTLTKRPRARLESKNETQYEYQASLNHVSMRESRRSSHPTFHSKGTQTRFPILVLQHWAISYVKHCYRTVSAVEHAWNTAYTTTFNQRLRRCSLEIQSEPESTAGSRRSLTSSDDDVALEVVSVGYSVIDRKVATLDVLDVVRRQLLLPLLLTVAVLVRVVLRRDDHTGLVGSEVRDDVTPTLVVVDAQRGDEVLAGVGREAKGAARSATTHGEHTGSIDIGPRSAVGVVPDGLLDDAEEGVRVGLVDLYGDRVTHSGIKR